MRLLHHRWRTRVSLLVSGVLEGSEREATLAHVATCEACQRQRTETEALLRAFAADPAHAAEPDVSLAFLVSRVQAHLDQTLTSRPWRWGFVAAGLAIGLGVAALAPRLVTPLLPRIVGAPAPSPSPPQAATLDGDSLRRLERNVAREQAVRYLNEAQDVLVTMAATPRPCDREKERVDVADEARRSRDLLARRALLVELDGEDVATARGVLEDVEHVLQEVATLQSCVRAGDVERVQREVARGRLLMKIRLMSRELQG